MLTRSTWSVRAAASSSSASRFSKQGAGEVSCAVSVVSASLCSASLCSLARSDCSAFTCSVTSLNTERTVGSPSTETMLEEARSQRVGLADWPICSRMSSALPSRRRRSTSRLRSSGLM